MHIGIFLVSDPGSDHNASCIHYVSDLLLHNMININYGAINYYTITCKAVKTIPGWEKFSQITRPRFVEKKKWQNFDKSYTEIYGSYTCSFKIDFEEYDKFISASDDEAKRMIARKVVESLSSLDRLSKKAAAFDKERFKADVIRILKEDGLLP